MPEISISKGGRAPTREGKEKDGICVEKPLVSVGRREWVAVIDHPNCTVSVQLQTFCM
jgi:hypothetical protein